MGGVARSHKTYNKYGFRGVAADWGGGDDLSGCRLPSSTHRGWICGQISQEVMLRFISGLRYLRVNSEKVLRCEKENIGLTVYKIIDQFVWFGVVFPLETSQPYISLWTIGG